MTDSDQAVPAEPPVATWVKDRHGALTMRHSNGGWAPPGCAPLGKWAAMWEARGPLIVTGPWGAALSGQTPDLDAAADNVCRFCNLPIAEKTVNTTNVTVRQLWLKGWVHVDTGDTRCWSPSATPALS